MPHRTPNPKTRTRRGKKKKKKRHNQNSKKKKEEIERNRDGAVMESWGLTCIYNEALGLGFSIRTQNAAFPMFGPEPTFYY